MKPSAITYSLANAFAQTDGHDEVIYETSYGDCLAYYVHDNVLDKTMYGVPSFVLVDKHYHCRYSTRSESYEIIDKKNQNN